LVSGGVLVAISVKSVAAERVAYGVCGCAYLAEKSPVSRNPPIKLAQPTSEFSPPAFTSPFAPIQIKVEIGVSSEHQ